MDTRTLAIHEEGLEYAKTSMDHPPSDANNSDFSLHQDPALLSAIQQNVTQR